METALKMNRVAEQFRLPAEMSARLEAFSKASGLSKTEIVEAALEAHMAEGVKAIMAKRMAALQAVLDSDAPFEAKSLAATAALKSLRRK